MDQGEFRSKAAGKFCQLACRPGMESIRQRTNKLELHRITDSLTHELALNSFKDSNGVFNGVLHWNANDLDLVKALAVFDLDIDSKNRDLRLPNVAFLQFVLDSHGALGLDFDLVSECFGGLLKLFGSHVGVRDSSGTRSYCNDLHTLALFEFPAASPVIPEMGRAELLP